MITWMKSKPFALAFAVALGLGAQMRPAAAAESQTLTVAGGCFWCVESDFEKVRGVEEAVSGFAGGDVENPTYKQVSRGGTGHRETVRITYDPDQVTERQLLDLFFRSIDPTDDGGQFCDRGHSYTTAVFVYDDDEKALAEKVKSAAQKELGQNIVTPIIEGAPFYPAGEYHQDYYKSQDLILSRFGPVSKEKAYHKYREACGRDARVEQLWGSDAPFIGG